VTHSDGVILNAVPSGLFTPPPRAQANNVYFVSYADGRLQAFSGAPAAADRWGSRFCYIVDIAEHRTWGSFELPSSNDAYSFTIEAETTWKVTNPEAVVRNNLTGGGDVVLARLKDELWLIGRQYAPGDAAGAELAARSALHRAIHLDQGITVLRCTARFRVDSHLTAAVLERDQATHQQGLDVQRMQHLRQLVDGSDDSMIMLHLLQHPDDTGTILQMMTDARDKNQAVQMGLLDRMLENKLITDADAQPLRDRVLGQSVIPPPLMRPIASRAQPQALPPAVAAPPPAVAPGPSQSQSQSQPAAPPAATKKVYLVADTDTTTAPPPRMRPISRPHPAPSAPAQAAPSAQPDPPPAPDPAPPAPPAGGVRTWKSLRPAPDPDPDPDPDQGPG
jgi:hypothetical protein